MPNYDTTIFRGSRDSCNKDLKITFLYSYSTEFDKFPTAKEKTNGNGFNIEPSFAISISEGFEKGRLFIPGNKYYAFITLFDKAVDLISENLYTLYPNINKVDFEIDSKALERFQTEKALAVAGITAMPSVWYDDMSKPYPAVKLNSTLGTVNIPLEDAIQIREMFKRFDPICYSASMLHFFASIRLGNNG